MTTRTPLEANSDILYDAPQEPDNVNCLYSQTPLGKAVAAYFNVNVADDKSMYITDREGEALAQFVIFHS